MKLRGMRYRDLGEAVARAVGRKQPFSVQSVSDFFLGRRYSLQLVEGISTVLDLPLPPVSSGDADLQRWADLGAKLQRYAPQQFQDDLAALAEVVEALEKYALRK